MFKRIVAVVLVVLGVFLFSCSGEDPATGGVVKSSAKEILSFQLVSPAVAGVITNQTILVTVPYGTDRSSLVPLIAVSSNASILPESGVANNFTSPNVVYRVTAEDGSTADYLVTVTNAPVNAKTLDTFGIQGGIAGGVDEGAKTAWAAVSFSTSLTALTPVFTFTGSVVSNNGAQLISGSGTINFTTAQQFDVYAADGSVQAYTVTVTNAPASTACLLTGFSIGGQAATIDQGGKTVSLTVPYGTDRSSLTPTITSSPYATVNPASGVARNFTSAVQYTVTAEDAAYSNVYTVTVSEAAPSAECQLLSFSLEGVAGTIDHGAGTVAVTLPLGTDISSLKPALTASSYATVSPSTNTAQDFNSSVVYTVTAQDGTTSKAYTVTVTLAAVTWHTETFDNMTTAMYSAGTSDSNDAGITWSFIGRTDEEIESGNKALMMGRADGYVQATLPNGVGKVKFKFKEGYDNPVILVYANGVLKHTTPAATSSIQDSGEILINSSGSTILRFEADLDGDCRVFIDDISWTDGGPVETDKPTVAISAPASGANLTSASATVSGTAADPGTGASGVKEVWVQLDSGSPVKASGTTSWSTTVSGMGDGAHTVYVYAIDNAGNISTTASVGFTVTLPVDTTNPTVSITTPTEDQSISGTGVTVTGTATDPGTDPSGVKEVWVRLDSGSWQKASGTTSWTYTLTGLSDDGHTLSVYAIDNQNNCSTTNARNFIFTYSAGAYPYIVGGVFQPQAGDPYYSYYSSAAGLSGSSLRTALKAIITAGHSVSSYNGLWTAYSTSDRIPSGPNAGKIWDMYSDTGTGQGGPYYYTYSSDQCGNYSGENSCYNREHSWPKSWFNNATPMYSDLVHLVPTDGYVNGKRSNWAFGIVGTASWTSMNGSKLGPPSSQMTTWGCGEDSVFEPIDAFKGDFARIYFYMCTRYWGTTEGGPMTSSNFRLLSWAQTMLKLWHEYDPVSAKETSRNTAIENHQGNRNPFVDYPGLVTIIDFTQ